MRKIDKNYTAILSLEYKKWVDKLELENKVHPASRTYYDDVAMELYRCQLGVCAYTERFICPKSLYYEEQWSVGRYKIKDDSEFTRIDHAGEMEHFDHKLKSDKYWLWSNLFMIDANINGRKSDKPIVSYLKPDLLDYNPKNYFDYDENTHRFIPNTDIEDETKLKEIEYMINEVLFLNHGVILCDRRDYINNIKQKKSRGEEVNIDRFFTSVEWTLN